MIHWMEAMLGLEVRSCEPSVWKNYKALQIYEDIGSACFQSNEILEEWINKQPLGGVVTCLGDGHDGIWNILSF